MGSFVSRPNPDLRNVGAADGKGFLIVYIVFPGCGLMESKRLTLPVLGSIVNSYHT